MRGWACEIGDCVLCGAEFHSGLTAEQVCRIRESRVKKTCRSRAVKARVMASRRLGALEN